MSEKKHAGDANRSRFSRRKILSATATSGAALAATGVGLGSISTVSASEEDEVSELQGAAKSGALREALQNKEFQTLTREYQGAGYSRDLQNAKVVDIPNINGKIVDIPFETNGDVDEARIIWSDTDEVPVHAEEYNRGDNLELSIDTSMVQEGDLTSVSSQSETLDFSEDGDVGSNWWRQSQPSCSIWDANLICIAQHALYNTANAIRRNVHCRNCELPLWWNRDDCELCAAEWLDTVGDSLGTHECWNC